MKRNKFYWLVWLILFGILFSLQTSEAKKTKSKKQTTATGKVTSKKKEVSKKKKPKKKKKAKIRTVSIDFSKINILKSIQLSDEVEYKLIRFGKDNAFVNVHLVAANIEHYRRSIAIVKAKNTINELDYLQNVFSDVDFELSRIYEGKILAMINGSFWASVNHYPVGYLIIDGEVLAFKKHKNWSTILFDEDSRPYIENFTLSGEIITSNRKRIPISNVNQRQNGDDIVIYNSYFGDVLPKLKKMDIDSLLEESIREILGSPDIDTNEITFDTTSLKNQILSSLFSQSLEKNTIKISAEYLHTPKINYETPCKIIAIDTGIVEIPVNGFVISIPTSSYTSNFRLNDTIFLYFSTDRLKYIYFQNGLSGTPKLVSKGIAKPNPYEEGVRSKRFISSQLPRTGIGTNLSKTKIFLFSVTLSNGSKGVNLKQFAQIAKRIGCYEAINLDGGSSTNFIYKDNSGEIIQNGFGRRISVGIGILERTN